MSQLVCLYSELEPHTGSISHNPSDLPRLIWDLKFACLFYDVVVVHRRNLWEHPLTLPAFERLKPFVKTGQLWISANESDHLPEAYIKQKVQELAEFFGKGYFKKINAVNNIKERWLNIRPGEWKIRRCGNEQAASVLKRVVDYLSKFEEKKFSSLYPLLNLVKYLRDKNDFNKEAILARVGMLHGLLHPAYLSEIATLIQTEFVRAGANFNNNAVIYPGKLAQCLTKSHFEPLPFAHRTLQQVKERTKSVGLDLDELINLPVEVLFELAQSEEWLTIRSVLLNDIFEPEIQREMHSVFTTTSLSFPNQVEKLLNISLDFQEVENSTPQFSPIFMPSPWALVSQSLLGSASVAASVEVKKVDKIFILDLENRVLYNEKLAHFKLELTPQHANLLSILVIAGKFGLTIEHITQWLIELDILKKETKEAKEALEWESQAKQYPEWDETPFQLRNRVDGLKRDINKKLKRLGLRIGGEKGKGIWYLESEDSDAEFIVKLSSTVGGEFFEKKEIKEPPQGLSRQSKKIWCELWKYSPRFVQAKTLAKVLERDWNEKTSKQISDAINKLKQQLKNESWMIKSSYSGEYALVPRALFENLLLEDTETKN